MGARALSFRGIRGLFGEGLANIGSAETFRSRAINGGPEPRTVLGTAPVDVGERLLRRGGRLSLERVDIGEIPRSTRRALVSDERVAPEKGNLQSIDIVLHPLLPGFGEREPGNACQDVDPARRETELNDDLRPRQIAAICVESVKRSTQTHEGRPDPSRVFRAGLDPHVEISACARNSVNGQRVSSNY